jgi:GNAT superfamily N-acetyltransferase
MKPGLYLESVPCDIAGSPAMAVCDRLAAAFANDPELALGVGLAVTPVSPRHVWISMIRAMEPGRGMGGRLMDHLCAACDAHGVTIELQAIVVEGAGGLRQEALDAFYARCGFARDRPTHRPHALARTPRGSSLRRAA